MKVMKGMSLSQVQVRMHEPNQFLGTLLRPHNTLDEPSQLCPPPQLVLGLNPFYEYPGKGRHVVATLQFPMFPSPSTDVAGGGGLLQETEEFLSNLVVSGTVEAKMDRLAGIVQFVQHKDPSDILNDWAANLSQLMGLVNKTNHLINKEEMVHLIH